MGIVKLLSVGIVGFGVMLTSMLFYAYTRQFIPQNVDNYTWTELSVDVLFLVGLAISIAAFLTAAGHMLIRYASRPEQQKR